MDVNGASTFQPEGRKVYSYDLSGIEPEEGETITYRMFMWGGDPNDSANALIKVFANSSSNNNSGGSGGNVVWDDYISDPGAGARILGTVRRQFTFDDANGWLPTDPSSVSTAKDVLDIESGDVTFSSDVIANKITVRPAATLTLDAGAAITAPNFLLESNSSEYSSLISNGSIAGMVSYDRFVNVVGSSPNVGNDIISFPVLTSTDDFDDFLGFGENATALAQNSNDLTEYAFAPYDNTLSPAKYVNFNSGNNEALTVAKGYRVATNIGQTIRFTGDVNNSDVFHPISTGTVFWNAVGNPYPSYLDAQQFLDANIDVDPANSVLEPNAAAIYAYNSGTVTGPNTINNYTIINKTTNTDINIAPGQGFIIADNSANAMDLNFTLAMRTTIGTDDFIVGRNANTNFNLRLLAESGADNFATEFYFLENTTRGLDIGYDAAVFGTRAPEFMMYSQLVDNNVGKDMAIQALSVDDLNDVSIPLGLKASQGKQVTLRIANSTLPTDIEVYLEDTDNNTFTLLNNSDYTFTASQVDDGTGRFFLRVTTGTLSALSEVGGSLQMFSTDKTLFIKGQLIADTNVNLYDVQGRHVLTAVLKAGSSNNTIDASNLIAGVYIVKLSNLKQGKTQKIILK